MKRRDFLKTSAAAAGMAGSLTSLKALATGENPSPPSVSAGAEQPDNRPADYLRRAQEAEFLPKPPVRAKSSPLAPMPLAERIRLGAVPRRGMCSTVAAARATDGLLSGNGKMWVEVFGDPFGERIVFQHEKLLRPWKNRPLEAPKIASVLPEVRRLMLAGEYDKGLRLSLDAAEKSDTKPGTGNLGSHSAFEMRIDDPHRREVKDYLRTTDFESGEVKVRWAGLAQSGRLTSNSNVLVA